jgi:hypothetical protein
MMLMSAGLMSREQYVPAFMQGQTPELSAAATAMYAGFSAPYKGLPDAGYNGYRRFPLSYSVRQLPQWQCCCANLALPNVVELEQGLPLSFGVVATMCLLKVGAANGRNR